MKAITKSVCAAALLYAPLAFGSGTACPSATGTTVGTINTEANGMGGGSTISTGGCNAGDQTFGNIGVTLGPGVTGGTLDAVSTANVAPTGQTFTFTGAWTVAAGLGATGSGGDTYLTQFGSGPAPTTDGSIEDILVTLSGINLPADILNKASIQATIGVCEAPQSTGGAGNGNGLAGFASTACTNPSSSAGTFGGTAYISSTATLSNNSLFTPITNGTLTFFISIPTSVSIFAIDTTFVLTSNATGAASFSQFTEDFESPEPSAFILLGTALAGLALLRCYRSGLFTRAHAAFPQSAQERMIPHRSG
jgi:hypothetical protein